jgi:precorrin-2 dehydrogenase/sirohydrochlorin ferrochelatase
MNDLIPLMIDLKGKKVVIFGGGEVGERKALLFSNHAEVVVISREFTPGLNRLSLERKIKSVEIKEMDESDIAINIEDAFIVIPATSDSLLNEKISDMAKNRGVLINRVDDLGDVIVPSVIKRGDIVIGISTQSISPALSKFMRIKIESVITPEFEKMAVLQNDIRGKLKSSIKEQRKRKEILWNILNDNDVWAALGESYDKAYNIALKHMDNRK